MRVRSALASLALLAIAACTPAGGPRDGAATDTAAQIAAGEAAWQRWDKDSKPADLVEAYEQFRKVNAAMPDNLEAQQRLYQVLFTFALLEPEAWKDALERHFEALNPLVRRVIVPPAIVEYVHSDRAQAAPAERIAILERGIGQQPLAAATWHLLARELERLDRTELALAAALRATALEPEDGKLAHHAGTLYRDLAIEQCFYERAELGRRSLGQLSRAAKLASTEAQYFVDLSGLYTRLGMFPMALESARKAHELAPTQTTFEVLLEAHLYLRKYAEARALLASHRASGGNWGLYSAALLALQQGEWTTAATEYARFATETDKRLSQQVAAEWLDALAEKRALNLPSTLPKPRNDWQGGILEYLRSDAASSALVERAGNRCEKTEAHFHTALMLLKAGQPAQAARELRSIEALGAHGFTEFLFARVLLEGPLATEAAAAR